MTKMDLRTLSPMRRDKWHFTAACSVTAACRHPFVAILASPHACITLNYYVNNLDIGALTKNTALQALRSMPLHSVASWLLCLPPLPQHQPLPRLAASAI